jgi:hypothetical protein
MMHRIGDWEDHSPCPDALDTIVFNRLRISERLLSKGRAAVGLLHDVPDSSHVRLTVRSKALNRFAQHVCTNAELGVFKQATVVSVISHLIIRYLSFIFARSF